MKQTALLLLLCLLTACAVKTPIKNEYKLADFSCVKMKGKEASTSILVTEPQAVAGYRTEAMLYMIKPFEIAPYAQNAWIGTPADMLFPLIVQTLQASGYFYAVTSIPYANHSDYRLDTQLLELQQNFLRNPSVVELAVKAVVTHVEDSRVVASRIFTQRVPCPAESPYGGVLAANIASKTFTAKLARFVIKAIERDQGARIAKK